MIISRPGEIKTITNFTGQAHFVRGRKVHRDLLFCRRHSQTGADSMRARYFLFRFANGHKPLEFWLLVLYFTTETQRAQSFC